MNIYVDNLPIDITIDEVREVFIAFGAVTSVRIMQTTHTLCGQPKKYCFVEMDSNIAGAEAIESLNGKKMWGLDIDVIKAPYIQTKMMSFSKKSQVN